MTVTTKSITDAINDRKGLRDYLAGLDPTQRIAISDGCACVYHGYLSHRFPENTGVFILFHRIVVHGWRDSRVEVYLFGGFGEKIQRAWSSHLSSINQLWNDPLRPTDQFYRDFLTAAECLTVLDGYLGTEGALSGEAE